MLFCSCDAIAKLLWSGHTEKKNKFHLVCLLRKIHLVSSFLFFISFQIQEHASTISWDHLMEISVRRAMVITSLISSSRHVINLIIFNTFSRRHLYIITTTPPPCFFYFVVGITWWLWQLCVCISLYFISTHKKIQKKRQIHWLFSISILLCNNDNIKKYNNTPNKFNNHILL